MKLELPIGCADMRSGFGIKETDSPASSTVKVQTVQEQHLSGEHPVETKAKFSFRATEVKSQNYTSVCQSFRSIFLPEGKIKFSFLFCAAGDLRNHNMLHMNANKILAVLIVVCCAQIDLIRSDCSASDPGYCSFGAEQRRDDRIRLKYEARDLWRRDLKDISSNVWLAASVALV